VAGIHLLFPFARWYVRMVNEMVGIENIM